MNHTLTPSYPLSAFNMKTISYVILLKLTLKATIGLLLVEAGLVHFYVVKDYSTVDFFYVALLGLTVLIAFQHGYVAHILHRKLRVMGKNASTQAATIMLSPVPYQEPLFQSPLIAGIHAFCSSLLFWTYFLTGWSLKLTFLETAHSDSKEDFEDACDGTCASVMPGVRALWNISIVILLLVQIVTHVVYNRQKWIYCMQNAEGHRWKCAQCGAQDNLFLPLPPDENANSSCLSGNHRWCCEQCNLLECQKSNVNAEL